MPLQSASTVAAHARLCTPLHRFAAWLGRLPLPLIQLLFCLAIVSVFMKAVLTKIARWEFPVQLFADEYQVPVLAPELAAVLATTIGLGCASLLLLEFATRAATLPLLGMLLVIQTCVYPNAWSEHLTWGTILLFLLTRGGGLLVLTGLFGLEPSQAYTARQGQDRADATQGAEP